jgi:hypothetical protein
VPYNRLIVISGNDMQKSATAPVNDVFQYHLLTNEVEKLPPISQGRTSFAAHYDFEDKFIYIIGGSNDKDTMITECEKFDVFNHKWHNMPAMNHPRGNPGTIISKDRKYLYAFQGFVNNSSEMAYRNKQSEALDTVERLDLTNEALGWHQIHLNEDLAPKGCFQMFHMENSDKVLIFGGWRPYQNLPDIQMFDTEDQ